MGIAPTIGGRGGVSRSDLLVQKRGLVSEAFPLILGSAGVVTMATQAALFTLIPFLPGDVVTNIVLSMDTAAVGTTPAAIYVGLYDKLGNRLAVSADLHASGIWTAGIGYVVAPLSAPYTVGLADVYYGAFLINGTFGTTQPTFDRGNPNTEAGKQLGTAPSQFGSQAGQTTLPASATIATPGGSGASIWMGAS